MSASKTPALKPPVAPMEAQSVDAIPQGAGWQYEPKWDGFRCLAFRRGKQVELQSKSGQPLARYFPEVVRNLLSISARQFVLDGEIVVRVGKELSFDELLMRIHPAASRIAKLSEEHPATLLVFDMLEDTGGASLLASPLKARRRRLETFAATYLSRSKGVRLSPATTNLRTVQKWFSTVGGALDGIIAKRVDADYRCGDRSAAQKVKNIRTADCVVGGFRYASKSKVVGSLLLGLYDEHGLLNHVGFTSGISADERKSLLRRLTPLMGPPGFTGKAPGGPSRWSTERSAQWVPLAPKLVVEVSYDHVTAGRFRHGTRILRWRPDKAPRQCMMDQFKSEPNASLLKLTS